MSLEGVHDLHFRVNSPPVACASAAAHVVWAPDEGGRSRASPSTTPRPRSTATSPIRATRSTGCSRARRTTDGPMNYDGFIAEVGALAMGSTTYEWILDHEFSGKDPSEWKWPYDIPCWVFTHRRLPVVPGAQVEFTSGEVAPVHAAMVAAAGGRNVWIVGRRRPGRPVRRRRAARRGDRVHRPRDARRGRTAPAAPDRVAPRGDGAERRFRRRHVLGRPRARRLISQTASGRRFTDR